MSNHVIYLNNTKPPLATEQVTVPKIYIGRQYRLHHAGTASESHGICRAQEYCMDHGRTTPLPSNTGVDNCFLWDINKDLTKGDLRVDTPEGESITLVPSNQFLTSQFVLSHGTLSEPQIVNQETLPQLITTARFNFVFDTSLPAVCLGVITLIEAQRFAHIKNNERYTLLDSAEQGPLLYIDDTVVNNLTVSPVLETTASNDTIQHSFDVSMNRLIPAQMGGSEIETITVLEQYTTYFMQRELPFSAHNIWTPVCAPINWGWSMRVARRHDGDWCIVRQKLLMPTVGHNGLEMPIWEGHQLQP